jgi:competence protein ComEA
MPEPEFIPPRPAVRWQAHLLLYGLLSLALAYVLISRYLRPLVLADTISIEPALVEQVQGQIDPNTASWPELARLPGVGESLAKRIIAYRDDRMRLRAGPVFKQPDDLTAVKGVGPKILQRMTPLLSFPSKPSP